MIFELILAIKAFLESSLKELRMRVPDSGPDEVFSVPKVIIGALPPKSIDGPDDYPFVLVRPSTGQDDLDEKSEASVTLVCGGYTAESIEGGFNDLLNLVSEIRHALMATRTIGPFALEAPIKWRIGGKDEDQPHPYYLAAITTNWLMPVVQEPAPVEEL